MFPRRIGSWIKISSTDKIMIENVVFMLTYRPLLLIYCGIILSPVLPEIPVLLEWLYDDIPLLLVLSYDEIPLLLELISDDTVL